MRLSEIDALSTSNYLNYLNPFLKYATLFLSRRDILWKTVVCMQTPLNYMSFPSMTLQNTELTRRLSVAGLHPDDEREISRIFPVMTAERQIQIFETWDSIVSNIKHHRDELEQEKEILLIRALENIESDLESYGRTLVQSGSKKDISSLKFQI